MSGDAEKEKQVLNELFTAVNHIDFSAFDQLAVPSPQLRELTSRRSLLEEDRMTYLDRLEGTSFLQWRATPDTGDTTSFPPVSLELLIPTCLHTDEVLEASLIGLIQIFGAQTISIYTALLTQKRILFSGFQLPASDVCNAVLSACLLVSTPLEGQLQRAYPYSNLTNLKFLEDAGYIAGVTNPIFEQRPTWWDLNCNIASKELLFAPGYQDELTAAQQQCEGMASADADFIQVVLTGIKRGLGEQWVRDQFRDHTLHLLDMAREVAVFKDSAFEQQQQAAHAYKLKGLKSSSQYQAYLLQTATLERESALAPNHAQIRKSLARLRVRENQGAEVAGILSSLNEQLSQHQTNSVLYRNQILEVLALMPSSQHGLEFLAILLFHTNATVRAGVLALFQKLDAFEEGHTCVGSLNFFLLLTYNRLVSAAAAQQQVSSSAPPATGSSIKEDGAQESGGKNMGGTSSKAEKPPPPPARKARPLEVNTSTSNTGPSSSAGGNTNNLEVPGNDLEVQSILSPLNIPGLSLNQNSSDSD